MNQVFLGGTCGNNNWRKQIVIPALLERGVSPAKIFDPVVEHWDEQAQEREDAAKANPFNLQVYVLANPDPSMSEVTAVSGYSLVEATMALYDAPARTAVIFDTTGLARKTAKGMKKAENDLRKRFPNAPIFDNYAEFINWMAAILVPPFLGEEAEETTLP